MLEGLIPKKEENGILSPSHLARLSLFAVMWSAGALLELADRSKMETFLSQHEASLDLPGIEEGSGDTIFEFVVDSEGISKITIFDHIS